MNILEVKDVTKRYADHLALDNVSLEINEGDIYGLLGPNGAGKTTLIRMINHITVPDKGQILFRGKRLTRDMVKHIGYLPEERGLYPKMKVGEQALYFAQLKGLERKEALKRLKVWFERFDITTWWNKRVNELSKGMQQKVQFICTVIHEPDLLILDEPFSGFDPINQQMLQDEITRFKEMGKTIIFSTHQMHAAENICDKMALINQSKKILDGNINEIKEQFRTNRYKLQYRASEKIEISNIQGVEVVDYTLKENTYFLTLKSNSKEELQVVMNKIFSNGLLIKFEEVIPSVHEIFIKCVTENH
ncbi:ATP-binding cassette domain-containing protein [Halosquirtibacter xylanolyticus]|uniref:ABC transporter ATP-binding protein n=1 Tax=Halosquirtibacter xylanolyticus TaxID=3374599 RepID=UPI0037491830|nr:ATP-binding cassette domain-containing protein [Prolixibacteraceae bacterium]